MDPFEFRRQLNAESLQLEAEVEPVGDVQDVHVEYQRQPLSLRIYTPQADGPFPLVVYVHGAGWVAGNVDTHDNVCRRLTAGVPAVAVSVDYRLAPEHRFPTALEDTYRALCWAVENTASLGGMVGHLAVAGDSAGGNLAAAVCLMARDRGGPQISFQLLINPALDLWGYDGQAFQEMRWFREQYLGEGADMCDPYASPLLAPDLSELPPAFVITGELDCLCAEGDAYARRLREAGVQANVYRQAGKGHLGRHFARATAEAAEAVGLSIAVLKGALSRCQVS
jgi:acetyl esterase